MRYLSHAINFTIKNWKLIIPMYAMLAIAALINYIIKRGGAVSLLESFSHFNLDDIYPKGILRIASVILSSMSVSFITAFLARFVYQPLTYGLANKGLETGYVTLNDIGVAYVNNFTKYIVYIIGEMLVDLVVIIAAFLVILILGFFAAMLKGFGLLMFIIMSLAIGACYAIFKMLTSLWFSGMVIDNLDVFSSFKKSIAIAKSNLPVILITTVLVSVAALLVSRILGFLNGIPAIGGMILAVIPATQTYILLVFSLIIYRDNTGRASSV